MVVGTELGLPEGAELVVLGSALGTTEGNPVFVGSELGTTLGPVLGSALPVGTAL